MKELSLHLLDVIENSAAAGAKQVHIEVEEDQADDLLQITVRDDGRGMTPEMADAAADPFTTTRTTRTVGMGLPLLAQAAQQAGGTMTISSAPGAGATVKARFRFGHIDRAPLGRIEDTLTACALLHPDLILRFRHQTPRGAYQINLPEATAAQARADIADVIRRLVAEGRARIGSAA